MGRTGAREREHPDQQTDEHQRGGDGGELLHDDPPARPRDGEQQVEGARLLFAARHPAHGKQRPDRKQRQQHRQPPGHLAAGREDVYGLGKQPHHGVARKRQRLLAPAGPAKMTDTMAKMMGSERAESQSPSEDREAAVPQRLQEYVTKPHACARPLPGRSAGTRPRGSAHGSRRW